jgi:hypothetical protein
MNPSIPNIDLSGGQKDSEMKRTFVDWDGRNHWLRKVTARETDLNRHVFNNWMAGPVVTK